MAKATRHKCRGSKSTTDTAGRFPTNGPDRSGASSTAYRKAPRPFLISGPASQSIPSWNQIMEWLREVQRIREIAGDAAA
jgi:hypothetical protein